MQQQNPPLDRRVQRTRQLLRDALFALIIERGYEQIAIGDITERANLGRTTFYLHYQDKEELLRASVRALIHELQIEVEVAGENICTAYRLRSIRVLRHVAERKQLYQVFLGAGGPAQIGDLMRSYFAQHYQRYILEALPSDADLPAPRELLAAHAAGSLFGLISWWLQQDLQPSAEQMGTIYCQLMGIG